MDGIIQKDDLSEIQACLTNAESLQTEIAAAVHDFSQGGVENYIDAVKQIGKIVQQLPTDLSSCQNIQGDLTKLEQWAAIFGHPVELAERLASNVFSHFKEIEGDVTTALSDWDSAKYFDFGDQVGSAVVVAVGSTPATFFEDCHGDDCPHLSDSDCHGDDCPHMVNNDCHGDDCPHLAQE